MYSQHHVLPPYLSVGTCCPLIIDSVPSLLVQLGPQSFGTPVVETRLELMIELDLSSVFQAQMSTQGFKTAQHFFALLRMDKGIEKRMRDVGLHSILLAHPPRSSGARQELEKKGGSNRLIPAIQLRWENQQHDR